MDKSPEAFRTISEVAEWLDVPTHVLRFWESRFTQVKPVKRAGGRRYYRPSDMALLGGIKKLLHEDGLTIRGVQKVLREKGVKHVASLVPDPAAQAGGAQGDGETRGARRLSGPEVEDAQLALEPPVAAPDPDAALHRFPFIDEPVEDVVPAAGPISAPDQEAEAGPAPAGDHAEVAARDESPAEPAAETAEFPAESESEPQVAAFVSDAPETDPEDDDSSIAIPGVLPMLSAPSRAARLAQHVDTLRALHERACALRDRIESRTEAK